MIYLDTSVLAAYYCPEPISDIVEDIILQHSRPSISYLTEVEFVSAVSRKIREKTLSKKDGNKILIRFQEHISHSLYSKIPLVEENYKTAKDLTSRFSMPLKTLDGLHLAVVLAHGLTMVTADIKLAESSKNIGIDVNLIGDAAL